MKNNYCAHIVYVCVCAQEGMNGGKEEKKWESQAEKQQPVTLKVKQALALGGSPHCARICIRCQILFTLKKQAEVVSLTAVTDVAVLSRC